MPTRTIYTTSEVTIGAATSSVLGSAHLVSAVTSATFTMDTPREQVTVFGKKGQIATVQNESTSSTIEIVFHPYANVTGLEGPAPTDTADADFLTPADLQLLMNDAALDNPTGETIVVAGVGKLTAALLTSITAEGSVGALPTITLGFDGNGTVDASSVSPDASSYNIANMENVSIDSVGAGGNTTSYAQTASFNWEMPIEKLNKLGNSVESATTYGTPPGTASISVEGMDSSGAVTGVNFGAWLLKLDSDSKQSNVTNNMAVGEVGATFNTTTEGVADGCVATNA